MAPGQTTIDPADAARALRREGFDPPDRVESAGTGVNDVFVAGERVVKFGTYSTAAHLRAGVAAYRVLGAHTGLPVPEVDAFDPDGGDLPPFVVMDHLSGEPLAEGFRDPDATDPDAVRLLGTVVGAFAEVPADGYGFVQGVEGDEPRAVGEYDDCAAWLVDYASEFLSAPADHDAVASVAPRALQYLRANRDRLPSAPSPSPVVTDLSPGNLLAPGGISPESAAGLTGVVDLERAKLGPAAFTAVNAEYLLTRFVDDPEPVREALYDPLPFGPDAPARDLYRLIALARSVGALGAWYEPGSETYRERGDAVARELQRIID